MNIIFPTNTRQIINEIRGAIGRTVEFLKEIREDCPTCTVDPLTGLSVDSFCATCSGNGYLITYSGTTISGHVIDKPNQIMDWSTAGKHFSGDKSVQIEYTDLNLTTLTEAKYVMVDGDRMRIKDRTKRGVPDLNRIIIDLELEE